jgi:hypothetical protein
MDLNIDVSGPVFTGAAKAEAHRYVSAVRDHIADRAVRDIRAYLPTQYMYLGHNGGDSFHNPVPANAGFLAASVHSDVVSDEVALVNDDPVTYGAWIEGVDVLNAVMWPGRVRRGLSPRFPGYHAFRLTAQVLQGKAVALAQEVLPPYLQAMNA